MDSQINQAVILAGGRGERLRPITNSIPKPMAPINGVPFMNYLLYSLIQVGITNILILLGYKSNVIYKKYNNMKNISLEFSHGSVNDQTGRRILNAYNKLDDYFLLMYGDNYWPIELRDMFLNFNRSQCNLTTTVFSNKCGTGEYGYENNIMFGNDGVVLKYDKKRKSSSSNGVDIGYFLVDKKKLDPNTTGNVSFEVDILPQFIAKRQLGAYVTDTQYYYITNIQSLKNFETVVKDNNFLPLPNNYFGG